MHYINERSLIKGGFVWVSTNGVKSIEVFARKLIISVTEDNEHLFSWRKKQIFEDMNKDCLTTFKRVIKQLSSLGQTIIFIIENCEGLIEHSKNEFRELLNYL